MTTPVINPDWIAAVRESVREAPFPNLLGFELTDLDIDRCRVDLTLAKHHLQPFGITHGGVIATLIDTATFWAPFCRLPDDTGLVNVDLKLNYLRATTSGHLTAHGRCLRAGRVISYAEASVFDDDGNLVAHGTSTLLAQPGMRLGLGVPKFLDPRAAT